jgi:hypothetical protein
MNPTRANLDEEEHRERSQAPCFYGEEITGQQVVLVLAETRHARYCSAERARVLQEYGDV